MGCLRQNEQAEINVFVWGFDHSISLRRIHPDSPRISVLMKFHLSTPLPCLFGALKHPFRLKKQGIGRYFIETRESNVNYHATKTTDV